jgi:hypothetical protein
LKYWPVDGVTIELLATEESPSNLSDWKSLVLKVPTEVK